MQRRALNDFHSNYYNHFIKLEILPIMYMFELYDIVFFIKSLQVSSSNFCITDYVLKEIFCIVIGWKGVLEFAGSCISGVTMSAFGMHYHQFIQHYPSQQSVLWNQFSLTIHVHTFHFLCPCHNCTKNPYPCIYISKYSNLFCNYKLSS